MEGCREPNGATQLKPSKKAALATLGALVVAAGVVAAAGTAKADPSGVGVIQNTQGESGYYANDNGQTRFRYVQAATTVTNQVKNLDGTTTNLGAVGVELCDPNTDYSIQVGVLWTGTQFQVQYGHGLLGAPIGGNDPCVQSGLVNGATSHLAFLNGFTPVTGDHVTFAIYYDPHSHWITVNSCDTTQDSCRQAHFNDGYKNLYEFGIGAVTQQVNLTAPALNSLVSFTNCQANYYSSTRGWNSIFVPAHWNLKRSDFVNSSDQVVMSSNGSLDGGGHSFSLFNGSTSA